MSTTPVADILQPISIGKMNTMMNLLKIHLPQSIHGHHYLYNYIKWSKIQNSESRPEIEQLSHRCNVQFFSHKNGNIENCTYIGISDEKDYWIFLHTIENTGKELLDCLKETNRINWHQRPIYFSVENQYFDLVKDIVNGKCSGWEYCTPEIISILPKTALKDFEIKIPRELNVSSLKLEDANVINELWPYKDHGSLQLIRTIIERNGGLGLYKKDTKELVAWSATNNYYAPGFLHTIETERRKGYGSIIFKSECKRIIEQDDLDIMGVVVQGNIASETLLKEIGFKNVNILNWIEIQ